MIVAMAFVLLISTLGFGNDILEALEGIPGVRESFILHGVYDIILKVEADTMGELKEWINKIRNAERVRSVISMIVIS